MNRLICVLLTSTFLTAFPPEPYSAQARSLFEVLFPQAAERRKQRKNRERINRNKRSKAELLRQKKAKQARLRKDRKSVV